MPQYCTHKFFDIFGDGTRAVVLDDSIFIEVDAFREPGELTPEQETAVVKAKRLRGPSTCKRCGVEGHRSDSPIYHPEKPESDKQEGIE